MTGDPCAEMHLLLQADLDGELSPTESARVAAHIDGCAACAALSGRLAMLSGRIRREATREPAPSALKARHGQTRTRMRRFVPAGVGMAMAAAVALTLLVPRGIPYDDELISSHVRALQPGHLLDVASSDQHTVKPWFAGKLDFSPTVRDLAAQAFPLVGGRLDYIGGRSVAVLVYRHRLHFIDVYVWPSESRAALSSRLEHGFNIVAWNEEGLAYRAVSDLDTTELGKFVALLGVQ